MDCQGSDDTFRVSGLMIRFFRANEELNDATAEACFGLTTQQMQAAMWLASHDGQTVGELAQALGVTPGWASRLTEELVASGKVARERDSRDRRVARLSLAPELKALSRRVGDERFAATEEALHSFASTEIETFCQVLERIVVAFEQLAANQTGDGEPAAGTHSPSRPAT